MKSFSTYFTENVEDIDEKALNLGNKSATPGFNQAVILAGAAGSGKSTVLDAILNIPNYKIFNSDLLKQDIVKYKPATLDREYKEKYGKSLSEFSFKNKEDVSNMHEFIKDIGLDKNVIEWSLKSNLYSKNKSNIVFDGTLKNKQKLIDYTTYAQNFGYEKKNIHLIWVLNDFEMAVVQNKNRDRTLDDKIVLDTAIGASNTMKDLLSNFADYAKYLDGDIYIVPNKMKVDNNLTVRKTIGDKNYVRPDNKEKTTYIVNWYNKICCKLSGQPIRNFEEIMNSEYKDGKTVRELINSYIPKEAKKF